MRSAVPVGSRTCVDTAFLRKMISKALMFGTSWNILYSTSYGQCLTDGSSAGSPARLSVNYEHVFTILGKCNNHYTVPRLVARPILPN